MCHKTNLNALVRVKLMDLLDVHCQSASRIESARALVTLEVLGLLVLHQH
jgi:hypothetical protein